MSDFSDDQAHPASPIRLEQAYREGHVPKSFELSGAVQTLGAIAIGFFMLGGLANWIRVWTIQRWQSAAQGISFESSAVTEQLQQTAFSMLTAIAPILILFFFVGVLAHWGQTGLIFCPHRVVPNIARTSPKKWWQHVFSMNSISLPFIGLPKIVVAVVTALISCWSKKEIFFALGTLPVEQIIEQIFTLVLDVSFCVALVLLLLSLADYVLQRWSFQRRLRMTDQQLREETRMHSGDPQIVAQRRELHRSMADGSTKILLK